MPTMFISFENKFFSSLTITELFFFESFFKIEFVVMFALSIISLLTIISSLV